MGYCHSKRTTKVEDLQTEVFFYCELYTDISFSHHTDIYIYIESSILLLIYTVNYITVNYIASISF